MLRMLEAYSVERHRLGVLWQNRCSIKRSHFLEDLESRGRSKRWLQEFNWVINRLQRHAGEHLTLSQRTTKAGGLFLMPCVQTGIPCSQCKGFQDQKQMDH